MTRLRWLALVALLSCGGETAPPPKAVAVPVSAPDDLLPPSAFDSIQDPAARSKALYTEASKVITSARCVNCHPMDDSPRQRDGHERHDPPVVRGPKDEGVPGQMCTTCHQDANVELARVPGAPKWHLAPKEMAWLGKSAAQICVQIKDPARNGGKSLDQLVDHMAHDPLVGWGWHPGADRKPAPGTQAKLGALVDAWVKTGAACPEEK